MKKEIVLRMKKVSTFLLCLLFCLGVQAQSGWTGTFATAVEYTGEKDMPQHVTLQGNTLRQIVMVSLGGSELQLQLSNTFGNGPVEIKSVYIADVKDSCDIDARTATYLTFGGKRGVTIKPGSMMMSDVVSYHLKPLQLLAVTICYGKKSPGHATSHRGARAHSFLALGTVKPGKRFRTVEKVTHWYNLSSINVKTNEKAVAVLGNSITDGYASTTDGRDRWTDAMNRELKGKVGVLNLGIGANCVVSGGISEPGSKRFDRDILGQQGVDKLIVFEGTNDIGTANDSDTHVADRLIGCYKVMIGKAHAKGIKVYGGTITPFYGNGWYTPQHEVERQKVNKWIRESGAFDGVMDFDKLLADPQTPIRMRKEYAFDYLHPNPRGYAAMGAYSAKILTSE
jgi:lysophospholipase L1-like esterase